jgi:hypothetical protein
MRDYDEQVKLVKTLRYCADHPICFSLKCPYRTTPHSCFDFLKRDSADAIEELVAEVPHWISVEEPPDNGRNIFICHGSADFKAPCIGHYEPNMKQFYEDKNWFASPIYDAMYWCEMPELPLPSAPKEEA